MKLRFKVILISLIASVVFSAVALTSSYFIVRESNNTTAKNEVAYTVNGFMDVMAYSDQSESNQTSLRQFINIYTDAVLSVYEEYADTDAFDEDFSLESQNEYLEAVAAKTEKLNRDSMTSLTSLMGTIILSNEADSIYLAYFDVARGRTVYLLTISEEGVSDPDGYVASINPYHFDDSAEIPEIIESTFGKNANNEAICYAGSAVYAKPPEETEDEDNEVVAYLLADLPMANFTSNVRQIFLYEAISMVSVALLSTFLIAVLTDRVLASKIRKINDIQTEFKDNLSSRKKLVAVNADIKSKDELGSLSQTNFLLQQKTVQYVNDIKLNAKKEERMQSDLDLAGKIQNEALPEQKYQDDKVKIEARMYPAHDVGGDFYHYFKINDDEFCALVADVSGKGIPAALFMMHSKDILENTLKNCSDLAKAVSIVNNQLVSENKSGLFLTLLVVILNTKTGKVQYINAGHEKPIIIHNGKAEETEAESNFVLGYIENFEYKVQTFTLAEGDSLFLYSDGLSEAINKAKQEFGTKRIISSLNNNLSVDSLRNEIQQFCHGEEQFDDETYLLLTYHPIFNIRLDNPKIENLSKVYDKISEYITDIKLSEEINVILDELLSNMIYYGLKQSKKPYIELKLSQKKKIMNIDIYNNGDDFDSFKQADKEGNAEGGFGLKVVKSLCDKYSYSRNEGINHIHLEKKIG